MITLGKFHQLKETALPSLLSTASRTLEVDMARDRETLVEVVDNMDQIVFEEFIKRHSAKLVTILQEGILHGGIDWLNTGKPTGASMLLIPALSLNSTPAPRDKADALPLPA